MSAPATSPTNPKAIDSAYLEPQILYEDNHLIAVDKPAGMPSQGDRSGDQSVVDWVTEYIRVKYEKPGNVYVGLLHRLDRPVGGVMLLAKTSKAAARMTRQFQERKLEKKYQAIAVKSPKRKSGRLEHFVGQLPNKNIVRAYQKPGEGRKNAQLEYAMLGSRGGYALLEVRLLTGRKHQIRVQLATMGCGIVGDVKYADTSFLPDKSIALRACEMVFTHPVRKTETIRITAPLPGTYPWRMFADLSP